MSETADERGFQGWVNYETWVVALWLDNDQDNYLLWRENAKQAVIDALNDNKNLSVPVNREKLVQKAVYALSQQLKEDFENNNPLSGQANAFADLLNAALDEVNFREVAENVLLDELVDAALAEWDDITIP